MARETAIAIGLGQPPGVEIEVASTSELAPGDLIWISFPFGARGWFKYGSEETFTVVSVDPDGTVNVIDEGGDPFVLPGGSTAELRAKLRDQTSFSAITIVRPDLGPPGSGQVAQGLGMPGGYREIPVMTWSDLRVGDYVLLGQATGIPTLVRVEDDDPELLIARVIGTESPSAQPGDLWYFEGPGRIFAPDAAFRGQPIEEGWYVAGAAVVAAGAALVLAFW